LRDQPGVDRAYERARRAPDSPLTAPYSSSMEHHVFRKRIRGIRMRWFGSGVVLGLAGGVFLTLLASALVVTQIPAVVQTFSGEPDVAVVIGETYLNREAASRVSSGAYSLGSSPLSLTGLSLDVQPGNRMDLRPTFSVDLMLTTLDISPAIQNQLSVKNGELVINMVGDPQLGDLNIPLELLPFDLDAQMRESVDRINNELLIAEINQSLESGFGGSDFAVEGVSTGTNNLTIRLQQR
jgi:hypothetical protein